MPGKKERLGLLTYLLAPLMAIVLIAGALVAFLNWTADRSEAEVLAGQRASAELSGIAEHFAELQSVNEAYAQLLAADGSLASAVVAHDAVQIARVLLPLKSMLGLRYIRVYDAERLVLLEIGSSDISQDSYELVGASRSTLTTSKVTAVPEGLAVLAATPIHERQHPDIVGTLVVGSVLGEADLKKVKERTGVDLLVADEGRLVASTLEESKLRSVLNESKLTTETVASLNQHVLSTYRLYATARILAPADLLIGLVSTRELEDTSWRRTLIALAGLGGVLVSLLLASVFLTRSIARASHAMVNSAKTMVRGNYSSQLAPSRIAELNDLAEAINDLGEQLEVQVEQLTHQAFHDPLSELPNRALFTDRLANALARASRLEQVVAVVFLDLDDFKAVNDSLGHQVGDQLLVAVAKRLQAASRPEDTVARFGGDEFTVLLDGLPDASQATLVAERIAERLRLPFSIGEREIHAGASVGIVVSEPGDSDAERLLRDADVAMYWAKGNGKGQSVVFQPSMSESAVRRGRLQIDLQGALERHELRLYYQPVVRLADGRLDEVEALVRWEHPRLGLLPPSEFIAIAERTGLILPIGLWVLSEACRQARAWQVKYPHSEELTVGVNLSMRQFQDPTLPHDVARILRETGLSPSCLKLEVTETAMMIDGKKAVKQMQRLKELGVKLAIDDFGTGYSSLGYLRTLPIDTVKIDRSFVESIGRDADSAAIVRAIVNLAKTLNLSVTGEGLETAGQVEFLQELECDLAQGYYYARPLNGQALDNVLRNDLSLLPPAGRAVPSAATAGNG